MAKNERAIPKLVVGRLTKYLMHVQRLRSEGVEWVSSRDVAEALGLTSSTVRQDLSHLDFFGVSKRGYQTERFEAVLASVLGADTTWHAVVVGAGNLGRALALHQEFSRRGFVITAVVDTDVKKIGRKIGRLVVHGLRELPALVGRTKADIGIIAVPDAAAQSVADLLIASGIKGLLNLSMAHIIAPKRVATVESRVMANLLELTHAIRFNS